jgi:hypothetical protein
MAPSIGSRRSAARIPTAARTIVGLLVGSTLLVGCASTATTPRPSVVASPLNVVTTPTSSIPPATTPTATVVANPLAVVGSPTAGVGPYTLGLVNAKGIVVAAVTANTPSDYGSTSDPSLTSTSDSRLYYEDGNTNIDYLTSTGQHGVAFTINRPSGAVVAFAVSPDDSRVAVAVLTNWDGDPPYTSHMYLMAMDGGIEQTLLDGTATSSTAPLTWPVGWDGASLVVAQSLPAYFGGYTPGTGPCASQVDCASQMRTFNPVNRSLGPVLCGGTTMTGIPTAAGIVCTASQLQAVSWSGVITSFGSNIPGGCMLSPQGAVIACPSDIINPDTSIQQNLPAQLFRAGGVVQKIPNPYNAQIMGWLDGSDVVVTTGVDSTGLAVENIVTGKQIAFSLAKSPDPWAVPWQFFGVIPGAL